MIYSLLCSTTPSLSPHCCANTCNFSFSPDFQVCHFALWNTSYWTVPFSFRWIAKGTDYRRAWIRFLGGGNAMWKVLMLVKPLVDLLVFEQFSKFSDLCAYDVGAVGPCCPRWSLTRWKNIRYIPNWSQKLDRERLVGKNENAALRYGPIDNDVAGKKQKVKPVSESWTSWRIVVKRMPRETACS